MKLLIVEENGAMCRLLCALLKGLPVAISECHDGSQVVAVCAQVRPDWVMIDLDLAGMDAFAAARQITTTHRDTRVLLLSEDGDARVLDAAGRAGVAVVVLKENLIDVRLLFEPGAQKPTIADI